MSDFVDQFFSDAKKLTLTTKEHAQVFTALKAHTKVQAFSTLTAAEKNEVLSNLTLHMRRNPIGPSGNIVSAIGTYFSFHRLTAGVLTIALLCSVSGGVAYASEDAMPDDLLYPVKLYVNEPIVEALQTTPEKKAQWEARRIERRLREAEHVAKDEMLRERHEEIIRARIEQRIEHLSNVLEGISEDQKEQIAERIDAELARHQEFLEALENGELPPPPPAVREMRNHIQDTRNNFRKKHGAQQQLRPTQQWLPVPSEMLLPPPMQNSEQRLLSRPDEVRPEQARIPENIESHERKLPRKPDTVERSIDMLKTQNDINGKDIPLKSRQIFRSQHPFFEQGASDQETR